MQQHSRTINKTAFKATTSNMKKVGGRGALKVIGLQKAH